MRKLFFILGATFCIALNGMSATNENTDGFNQVQIDNHEENKEVANPEIIIDLGDISNLSEKEVLEKAEKILENLGIQKSNINCPGSFVVTMTFKAKLNAAIASAEISITITGCANVIKQQAADVISWVTKELERQFNNM